MMNASTVENVLTPANSAPARLFTKVMLNTKELTHNIRSCVFWNFYAKVQLNVPKRKCFFTDET